MTVDELFVADAPAAWEALGFEVDGETCVVGGVRIRLVGPTGGAPRARPSSEGAGGGPGAATGLRAWSLRGLAATDLDGLETHISERPPPASPRHPNGVAGLDHLVAITPDLDRTVAALRSAGLDLRRVREEPTPAGAPRQAFFRLGETILEVVQEPPEAVERKGPGGRAFFWGLALLAPEIEATVERLGAQVGEVRPAVQPGRRIARLRRSAGLSVPVALISP